METVVTQKRCQDCSARVVCRCLQITEEKVVDALITLGISSIKELKQATGAGDGCTCCHKELKALIDRFTPQPVSYPQPSSDPICSCR